MNDLWNQLAARSKRALTDFQHARLHRFLDLLLEANQTMNLTRIVDRPSAEVQHIADALTLLEHLSPEHLLLADVGTGGGVPGIPLAIALPDLQVTLIEATQKKAAFLQRTVAAMELSNVKVIAQRAEEVGQGRRRESFDVAVARAVGAVAWLAEWCLPLVKPGGKVLAMKGPKALEEIPQAGRAIKLLGGGKPVLHPVELPGAQGLLILEIPKIEPTPKKFPRPATATGGRPL